MKHLVLTPDRNKTGNDFEGAFKPESERYALYYSARGDTVETHRIDVSRRMHRRAEEVEGIINQASSVDRLVFFCHGWETGIQLGFSSGSRDEEGKLLELAGVVRRQSTADLKVALYACLAAKGGASSFAGVLFESLRRAGCAGVTVFGHTDAGHTTRNADAAMFDANHPEGRIIAEGGTAAYRRFNRRLDTKTDDLRWRAPYMGVEELRAELEAEPP